MDVKALKVEAMEATNRFFVERGGFLPSEDSEEWEEEYRRQFSLAKERYATKGAVGARGEGGTLPGEERNVEWPELTGPVGQRRWAAALRDERLKLIRSHDIRVWVAHAWTASRDWIETRDLPPPAFLRRLETQYSGYVRQSEKQAREARAEQQARAAASADLQHRVQAAGISAAGLIELIDLSVRATVVPLKLKLAEVEAGGRKLRIFETGKPGILMVIETAEPGRTEYAIERDEGLVADLKLFAESNRA
ncbi:MAG TPA: hypothetical protein VLX85_02830 [Stellaceae bacterium]|nr:hypothetical protein [Stellaceae bacterium]